MGGYSHIPITIGMILCLLYSRLDGPRDRSGWVQKTSLRPGFDPTNIKPVASRIDYAIPGHNILEDQVIKRMIIKIMSNLCKCCS